MRAKNSFSILTFSTVPLGLIMNLHKIKVNFIICGAQKSGTTALAHFLRQHPEICFSNQKEVHFFDNERLFSGTNVNYSVYHKSFPFSNQHKVIGEVTPIYMYWQPCMKRIWQYNPEMKLIAILRNPIERAYSHWNMEVSRGSDNIDFSSAIRYEAERCRNALPFQHRIFSYVDRGFYSEQIRRIIRFFPKEQCFFLKTEELGKLHDRILKGVFKFLEVDPSIKIKEERIFKQEYGEMKKDDKDFLKETYHFEIRQLEKMLNWSLESWLRI